MSEPGPSSGHPIRTVVVSSWFPALDDSSKGRFVADQVDALRATGAVEPLLISFDPARLTGGPLDRRRQAAAVHRVSREATRSGGAVFSSSGWSGPPGVPVARLPIASGGRGIGARTHHAQDRRIALDAVAGLLPADGRTVVHAHTGYPDGAAATTLADRLAAPFVITEHATYLGQQLGQPELRREYEAATRRAARVIAVSQSLADELRALIPECAPKLVVLPNSVAVDQFRAAPLVSRDPNELLYVGYRTKSKGMDTLLQAFALVHRVRPTTTLRLLGRSPSDEVEGGWRRLADDLGLGRAVCFEGPALRPDVADAMARASLLVHASRHETFGVAPVEALASGLPVIATETGPLREILGDEPARFGALVPVGDAGALAHAITVALDARETFDPQVLRASVEQRFGASAVARRLVRLYEEVLAEGSGRPTPRATASATWSPPAEGLATPTGGTLVVALDTAKAARWLAALPASVGSRLWVVCAAGSAAAELPSGLGRVIAVDLGGRDGFGSEGGVQRGRSGAVSRLIQLAHMAVAFVRARSSGLQRDAEMRAAVGRATADLRASLGEGADIEVVCFDGIDYLAAEHVVASGLARPAPGGMRWLADQGAAAVDEHSGRLPSVAAAVG